MRTRGSYRPFNAVVKTEKEDVVTIADCKPCVKKRLSESHTIEVITIDSDEELEDDIQVMESRYVSTITKRSDNRSHVKRCHNCLNVVKDKVMDNGFEYNRLTSEDFYKNPRIHPSSLCFDVKDKNRFECFRKAIQQNESHFIDKTVLVIGSGVGIIALFAAKAMAKTVIVYDRPGIWEMIESVIESNRRKLPNIRTNFFIMREPLESMVLPNGITEVDVIVSDWANNSLFYKSLIEPLIKARDKWLRKDGLLLPDWANLYLSGANDSIHRHVKKDLRYSDSVYIERIDYWTNVYTFDMSLIGRRVLSEPHFSYLKDKQFVTNECLLKGFDLYTMTLDDINFGTNFELSATQDNYFQTFVLTFEVIFDAKGKRIPIKYSTRPSSLKNIFRPTIFFIDFDKQMIVFNDNRVKGKFTYSLNSELNELSVDIRYNMKNKFIVKNERIFFKTH